MYSSYTVRLVRVREYQSRPKASRQAMLPTEPGIYLWTRDLLDLADDGRAGSLAESLGDRLAHPSREFQGRIEPYARLSIRDEPRELSSTAIQRIESLGNDRMSTLAWSLLCGTMFQRPLYVGKARNIAARIRGHLRTDSRLRAYLADEYLEPNDCAIVMLTLLEPQIVEQDEEEFDEGHEYEAGTAIDPDLAEVDRAISAAESLVIRLGRPLLNRKQD